MPDGREYLIRLLDVSLSGAALRADVQPPMGTVVTIGRTKGKVVRVMEGGFAVEFLRALPAETFDENVRL